jgi:hypothetical protein
VTTSPAEASGSGSTRCRLQRGTALGLQEISVDSVVEELVLRSG